MYESREEPTAFEKRLFIYNNCIFNRYEIGNLLSHLFLIETTGVKELSEVLGRVVDVLRKEVESELQRNFGLWFRKRKMDIDIDIARMTGQEVRTMLRQISRSMKSS